MKISEELYTFFKEWLEWAEDGGRRCGVFVPSCGLCPNFRGWRRKQERPGCEEELEILLKHTFIDLVYPFGEVDYHIAARNCTQHKCPKRLAFVCEQIKKYEEG